MSDGGEVNLESGLPPETVRALQARGHEVAVANDGGFGGYQAILRNDRRRVFGASETRKDGAAQGVLRPGFHSGRGERVRRTRGRATHVGWRRWSGKREPCLPIASARAGDQRGFRAIGANPHWMAGIPR